MIPLPTDIFNSLSDLWGSKMSLLNQSFSNSNAVTQRAIASCHLISESFMFTEEVKGRREVTTAVSAGQDLLLFSDPSCLLSNVP